MKLQLIETDSGQALYGDGALLVVSAWDTPLTAEEALRALLLTYEIVNSDYDSPDGSFPRKFEEL